ncbi:hypothetical protein JTE90_006336 [Oedothorax gibbosus]|uniref:Uncharacterized protein n=1 Tax=Oedothorax gibbosus TaxID=931172 RepID=A0AAV6UMZ2_9ARAC|nr:hypothetical protein JTE90_006336 [Oedothorax gibbosus]
MKARPQNSIPSRNTRVVSSSRSASTLHPFLAQARPRAYKSSQMIEGHCGLPCNPRGPSNGRGTTEMHLYHSVARQRYTSIIWVPKFLHGK